MRNCEATIRFLTNIIYVIDFLGSVLITNLLVVNRRKLQDYVLTENAAIFRQSEVTSK